MISRIFSILFLAALFIACEQQTPKNDFVTLSGTVSNPTATRLLLKGPGFLREIPVDAEGVFQDTMKLEEGFYMLSHEDAKSFLYLKNSYNLDVRFDANEAIQTLAFAGLGAGTNNYMAEKIRFEQKEGLDDFTDFFMLNKPDFDQRVAQLESKMNELIAQGVDLDTTFLARENQSNERLIQFLNTNYSAQHEMLTVLAPGQPSPTFSYPDINGKVRSLDEFKGNYVYVDVWATWCGPCKVEIPYLKELEHEYAGKKITFVALSIDTQENKSKWEKMVAERNLDGVQLLADKDWDSQFIQDYRITGIPRFILIDPNGKIISHDAPRPSEPALKALFEELKI